VKAATLVFYILSALFVNSFVIIFVITVLLATIDLGREECQWKDIGRVEVVE
jgi:hypothetical protein